jgi:hypothetical protein
VSLLPLKKAFRISACCNRVAPHPVAHAGETSDKNGTHAPGVAGSGCAWVASGVSSKPRYDSIVLADGSHETSALSASRSSGSFLNRMKSCTHAAISQHPICPLPMAHGILHDERAHLLVVQGCMLLNRAASNDQPCCERPFLSPCCTSCVSNP